MHVLSACLQCHSQYLSCFLSSGTHICLACRMFRASCTYITRNRRTLGMISQTVTCAPLLFCPRLQSTPQSGCAEELSLFTLFSAGGHIFRYFPINRASLCTLSTAEATGRQCFPAVAGFQSMTTGKVPYCFAIRMCWAVRLVWLMRPELMQEMRKVVLREGEKVKVEKGRGVEKGEDMEMDVEKEEEVGKGQASQVDGTGGGFDPTSAPG